MSDASPSSTSATLDGHGVFEAAPLGALLRYFDGAPEPPARFTRKLRDWRSRNGVARLVEKSPASTLGGSTLPAGFTLHEGDFGSEGVIVVTVRRLYQVTTALRFEIIERPKPGMARVLCRWNGRDELKHLAANLAEAQAYMRTSGYSDLIAEIVEDDGVASDPVG